MNRVRRIAYYMMLVASATLIGCSATGPVFSRTTPLSDSGVLYIYRPSEFCLSARSVAITVDRRLVGYLQDTGYLVQVVSAGQHYVYASGIEKLDVFTPVEVAAGQEVFVKWSPGCIEHAASMEFHVSIRPVDPSVAQREISQTRLSQ